MPLYEYIDEANDEIVEIYLHVDECDDIGAIRNHDGRKLRRVLSSVVSRVDNGFVSRQTGNGARLCRRDSGRGLRVL